MLVSALQGFIRERPGNRMGAETRALASSPPLTLDDACSWQWHGQQVLQDSNTLKGVWKHRIFKKYIIIVFICLLHVSVVAGRTFDLHCSMWEL